MSNSIRHSCVMRNKRVYARKIRVHNDTAFSPSRGFKPLFLILELEKYGTVF